MAPRTCLAVSASDAWWAVAVAGGVQVSAGASVQTERDGVSAQVRVAHVRRARDVVVVTDTLET